MEKKTQIKITIEFVDIEEDVKNTEAEAANSTSMLINCSDADTIDGCEQALLEVAYPAMRKAMSKRLSEISKKKNCLNPNEVSLSSSDFSHNFRVVSELGRFEFAVYADKLDKTPFFAKQVGRSAYKTLGYKEIGLYDGVCKSSYSHIRGQITRQWRQPKSLSTSKLQSEVIQEAKKISTEFERQSQEIFAKADFDVSGQPKEEVMARKWEHLSLKDLEVAQKELIGNAPEDLRQVLEKQVLIESQYETKNTCYPSVDDVCCKRQKEYRKEQMVKERGKDPLKRVYNSVIRVQLAGHEDYTLVHRNMRGVLMLLMAFILNNDLLNRNWLFLVDGQRSMKNAILYQFGWQTIRFIMDWYHVQKKCRGQLSMALNHKDYSKEVLMELKRRLWYGLHDEAIQLLEGIADDKIKNRKRLNELIEYLNRHREALPNYALRKQLGLPNSSNPAENANNQLVSKRQKHNGMSWTDKGSQGLAKLIALDINKERQLWLTSGKFAFRFRKKAA